MKYLIVGLSLLAAAAEPVGIRAVVKPMRERQPAAAFRLADASTRMQSLTAYNGKVILLNFWATDCGGCKVEIPWFMDFARRYKSSGFEVVGVSEDIPYEGLKTAGEAWSRVSPWVRLHQVNYPILMGDDKVMTAYHITALPLSYLIDRNGRVAAEYPGLVDKDDIERNIMTLLRER